MNDDLRAHLEFFGELGVDGVRLEPEWHSRPERQPTISIPIEADEPKEVAAVAAPPTESVEAAKEPVRVFASEAEALGALRVEIGPDCRLCKLHTLGRKQVVFGVGNPNADLMFVGEAPGADEDIQGEPFVGRAGQLLNSMLKAVGLKREQVFIANILKSRPPNNRDPRPEEVRACLPYLFRQIELVNPQLILCVGRIAAQTLLETDISIGKLRGQLHRIAGNRPMIVTYHPAYLLRSPGEKRKSWADLLLALRTFESLSGAST